MGDSLYSWHVSDPAGGSPAGPPGWVGNHAAHTVSGAHLYSFVVHFHRPRRRWCKPRRWAPRSPFYFLAQGVAFCVGIGYQPHRGFYPMAVFPERGGRGKPRATWSRPEWVVKKKLVQGPAGGSAAAHLAAVESNVFANLTNLVAHCSMTRYDDGDARKPGWFTVKTMGASWVVQVKDPDGKCSMNLTAQSLDDALALADMLLGAEDAPWEPDPFLAGMANGKKK